VGDAERMTNDAGLTNRGEEVEGWKKEDEYNLPSKLCRNIYNTALVKI
jgi:hypothetical protein